MSNEAVEDAIFHSQSVRAFFGIDLAHEYAPATATLLRFRPSLETIALTQRMLAAINATLTERSLSMRSGVIVEGTITNAQSSAKNKTSKYEGATSRGN